MLCQGTVPQRQAESTFLHQYSAASAHSIKWRLVSPSQQCSHAFCFVCGGMSGITVAPTHYSSNLAPCDFSLILLLNFMKKPITSSDFSHSLRSIGVSKCFKLGGYQPTHTILNPEDKDMPLHLARTSLPVQQERPCK
jgi:hypothetical protein